MKQHGKTFILDFSFDLFIFVSVLLDFVSKFPCDEVFIFYILKLIIRFVLTRTKARNYN
jgi:hypothetical protein